MSASIDIAALPDDPGALRGLIGTLVRTSRWNAAPGKRPSWARFPGLLPELRAKLAR